MQNEEWRSLEPLGYPDYDISSQGRVVRTKWGTPISPQANQFGVMYVTLYLTGQRYVVALSRLVAQVYIPDHLSHFDTVTHKDGDRSNCRVENLVWRPLWYSRMYHKLILSPSPFLQTPIFSDDGLVFDDTKQAAIFYGLLEQDICRAASTGRRIQFGDVDTILRMLK